MPDDDELNEQKEPEQGKQPEPETEAERNDGRVDDLDELKEIQKKMAAQLDEINKQLAGVEKEDAKAPDVSEYLRGFLNLKKKEEK